MSTAEERMDLKINPLPDCSTCDHCSESEASCSLDRCSYVPDDLHDDRAPVMERAYLIQERISSLQAELIGYQSLYNGLIEKAATSGITQEGAYTLIDKKRSVRVPDPVKFKEQFPGAYAALKQENVDRAMKAVDEVLQQDLTTIPVKRAEELVGKIPLTKISDEKVYHNYSILHMEATPS